MFYPHQSNLIHLIYLIQLFHLIHLKTAYD